MILHHSLPLFVTTMAFVAEPDLSSPSPVLSDISRAFDPVGRSDTDTKELLNAYVLVRCGQETVRSI
jgi:hypothetical protein